MHIAIREFALFGGNREKPTGLLAAPARSPVGFSRWRLTIRATALLVQKQQYTL